ncbi:uncharacterized protein [Drosophila kikkawai]|uniref:Integrase catalytic domain-containing protein n=1 Tax=Drosophila kikkawai TaxID=30033 RepID=A0ABM4GQB0_DROKI
MHRTIQQRGACKGQLTRTLNSATDFAQRCDCVQTLQHKLERLVATFNHFMELSDDLVEFNLEDGYEDPGLDIPEYEEKFYSAHAIFSNAIKEMGGQDYGQDQSNLLISSTVERLFEGQNQLLEQIHTSSSATDLSHHTVERANNQALLPTILANVIDACGNTTSCRLLLDTGSTITMVSESFIQRIGISRSHARISVVGLGASPAGVSRGRATFTLLSRTTTASVEVTGLIMSSLTSLLPAQQVKSSSSIWNKISRLPLADPTFGAPGKIDVILGADQLWNIYTGHRREFGIEYPIALHTNFGWVITGSYSDCNEASTQAQVHHAYEDLDSLVRSFMDMEQVHPTKATIDASDPAEQHFLKTHARTEDGVYIVQYPFKEPIMPIGSTLPQALNRFAALERKFRKFPALKQQYVDFMEDYLRRGHMELIPATAAGEDPARYNYLAHHAVFKPDSTTTRCRVVFDGSGKDSKGHSLNSRLHIGPPIQRDLLGVCLRFRQHRYVFCADIEKMFRGILVADEHTHYQRIVWRKEETATLDHYRLLTVTYGLASSPFIAVRVLKQLATDYAEMYPNAAVVLNRDAYVDDIPPGITTALTTRILLSELAKIYDPLGLLAPTTVFLKILFQDSWLSSVEWSEDLVDHQIWWNGPAWLSQSRSAWPPAKAKFALSTEEEACLEVKAEHKVNLHISDDGNSLNCMINKISSWSRLIRILSYCFRFVHRFRGRTPLQPFLAAWELQYARSRIFAHVQKEFFSMEYTQLSTGQQLSKKSKLIRYTPFLDEQGIMRVGGRIDNSLANYDAKHPIILPKESPIAATLILYQHSALLHAGVEYTFHSLRQRYWILGARNLVRKTVFNCRTCFLQRRHTASQLMADLPEFRVQPARCFLHTGLDYAGPVSIKISTGRTPKFGKAWFAIFVCLSTKAIHIELVSDLTTSAFIAAFQRFWSRRGPISDLYSDNGTTFHGAKKELAEMQQIAISQSQNEEISSFLSTHEVNWHFIPPSAPHFGGIWETGVRSIKLHLKRVVGSSALTFEEYSTLLIQIEGLLNSRPLCAPSDHSLNPLTPSHFLTGQPLTSVPEPSLLDVNINRLQRWRQLQAKVQGFWKRWNLEYLNTLQARTKWQQDAQDIAMDTLVVLKEPNQPPSKWLLGRVVEVHPGQDQRVRVVTVKTARGTYKRPITKIAVLPLN